MAQMLDAALAAIDAANAQDPNEENVDGMALPKELVYGRRMSGWLEKLRPDAPEALRLAARAQHVRRWEVPRESYPMDRTGYLMWRKGLYKYHAEKAAEILRGVGYDEETIERVSFLLQKRQLNRDADTQTLEDCACLVFLEFHADEFEARTDEAKMIGILQKTWGKMSEQGHTAALGMTHSPRMTELIGKALAPGAA